MINLAYVAIAYLMASEVLVFCILALPFPTRIKGRLANVVLHSKFIKVGKWVFLAMCVISGVFYAELVQTQSVFEKERRELEIKT